MNARTIRFGMGTTKYGSKKTVFDGITFDSKKEARRYAQLQLLESVGAVKDLQRQVPYRCEVNGVLICKYIADFVYLEKKRTGKEVTWEQVVEDVKGFPNDRWPMKRKLMLACHNVKIRET